MISILAFLSLLYFFIWNFRRWAHRRFGTFKNLFKFFFSLHYYLRIILLILILVLNNFIGSFKVTLSEEPCNFLDIFLIYHILLLENLQLTGYLNINFLQALMPQFHHILNLHPLLLINFTIMFLDWFGLDPINQITFV